MLTRTLLSSPLLVASIGLAPHLAGCLDTTIVGGEGGSGGAPASVAVGTGAPTGGAGGSPRATAWFGSELSSEARADVCPLSPCDPLDDDILYLTLDPMGGSCSNPIVSEIFDDSFTETTWMLAIGVPPSAQEVGVHELDDAFYMAQGESVAGQSGPSGVVAAGGFGWSHGTIEILELTDEVVRFVTQGLDQPSDGVEYAAGRCGSTVLTPEGIALAVEATGGEGGAGGGGGSAVDAGGVTVVVGSELALCTAELATTCSGDTWQVAVSLPADYLTPGLYTLTDPRITVTNCTAQPKFLGGTIEVRAVSDDALVVRFAGVIDHTEELQQELRIDRCP